MTNVNEIWIPALNWENIYEVSNLGRVRRCIDNFIYKPRLMSSGYHYIGLRKTPGGKTKNVSLHRLILSSFTGLQEGKDVNHKDGNKHNNELINLEWLTRSENIKHAIDIGIVGKGVDHFNSVLYLHKEYGIYLHTNDIVKLHGCCNSTKTKIKWNKILENYIKV
jgi:HNH endonuclease/NUMOD4 motif